MISTGRFPIINSLRSGNFWLHKKQSNGYWSKETGSFAAIPQVIEAVNALLRTEKAARTYSGDYFGTDGYTSKGVPMEPLVHFQHLPKILNSTDFHVAKKDGRIAVSDYQTGMIKWTFNPGGVVTTLGPKGTRTCNVRCLADRHSIYKWTYIGGAQGYALQISKNLCISGAFVYDFEPLRIQQSGYPSYTIPNPSWLLNQLEVNGDLVTKVTADANRKTLDVLTALAELPETLRMIINACKEVLRLYRDARKGEIRLQNKSKRLRLAYDEALRELSRAERNSELSKRRVKLRRKQLLKDLKEALSDIASAISNVWLTYRYGIMPNVYLVEDIFKTNENLKTVFFEYTSTENIVLGGPDPLFKGDINSRHKHFIKRKLKPGLGANLSFNPFVTAWELIPLSFVVDWFISIGDFIASLRPPSLSMMDEGSTYSWKVTGVIERLYDDKSSVTADVQLYKRNVINPQLYCKLSVSPDFSPIRQYDALALTWQIALKRHFKGI